MIRQQSEALIGLRHRVRTKAKNKEAPLGQEKTDTESKN